MGKPAAARQKDKRCDEVQQHDARYRMAQKGSETIIEKSHSAAADIGRAGGSYFATPVAD